MSFLRPEAAAALRRWGEPALWFTLAILAPLWLITGGGGWLRWLIASSLFALGAALAWPAAMRALAKVRGEAPGVVAIDERRISYFGPETGGVLSLDELGEITVFGPRRDWRLFAPETGDLLVIPSAAEGADQLMEAFAALPGFAPARAAAALRPGAADITIWRAGAAAPLPQNVSRLKAR